MDIIGDYLYFIFIIVYAIVIGILLIIKWILSKVLLGIYSMLKRRYASSH